MRILIYGAGVIGSLYVVLFAETGYDKVYLQTRDTVFTEVKDLSF